MPPTYRPTNKKEKVKTVRERICQQRRRVHVVLVPRVVNEWMKKASGFTAYRSSIAIKGQPSAVYESAKMALRKDDVSRIATYLEGGDFGDAFEEACLELMRGTRAVVINAVTELARVVPSARLDELLQDAMTFDVDYGHNNRSVYDFDEKDAFLPHQLAFVVVKVRIIDDNHLVSHPP